MGLEGASFPVFLAFKTKCQVGSVTVSGRQLNNEISVRLLLQTRQLSLVLLFLKCADDDRRVKKPQPTNNGSSHRM